MTNSLSKAGKRFFAHDPDVRRYTAADTTYDDEEYVPEHVEDERAEVDRRKVSLILLFFPTPHTHTPLRDSPSLPHSFPAANVHLFTHTQRDIPPGLSERDAAILHSVKRRASVLDKHFKFCGIKFGWTFIVGTLPHSPPTFPLSSYPTPPRARTLMLSAVL